MRRVKDSWIGLAMAVTALVGGFCIGWLAGTLWFWISR